MNSKFDSVESICSKVYHIHDNYGFAFPMFQKILVAAQERNYGVIVCPDPEHITRIKHLLIPELGTAFVTIKAGEECPCSVYRRIHIDSMLSPAYRKKWKGRLAFLRKMKLTLRDEGVVALKEAKQAHDALEAMYHPHVDFVGLDRLTAEEIARIESYL